MAGPLSGKKIVLGLSGSIAAYKGVFLLRLLVKAGAEVRVAATPSLPKFVGELSLSSLSGHRVFSDLWGENWSEHVALGNWADLMLVAPATANTLAKMAHGLCDNALLAIYLAAKCPVMVAPAMDADMYIHPRTQANLRRLEADGLRVLPVENGFLASGLEGPGRMLEPEAILREVESFLLDKPLAGRRVLITAGPTREAIDPVRYISNHSTGKMGYALAAEAARMGAEVLLVSGPVSLDTPPGTNRFPVQSAQEMFDTVMPLAPAMDLLILSAAVADYTPETVAEQKIKKSGEDMAIRLKKTPDILATLGAQKGPGQVLVGFALETNNELAHARQKLERKRADLIVLNSLRDPGAGFGTDTNQITLLRADGTVLPRPLMSKQDAAREILRAAAELLPPLPPAS